LPKPPLRCLETFVTAMNCYAVVSLALVLYRPAQSASRVFKLILKSAQALVYSFVVTGGGALLYSLARVLPPAGVGLSVRYEV